MRGVSNRRRSLSVPSVRRAVVESVERRLHLSSSQGRLLGSIPLTSSQAPTIGQTLVYNDRLFVVLRRANEFVEQLWSVPTNGVGTPALIASASADFGSQYDDDTTGISALTVFNGKLYFARSGAGAGSSWGLMSTDGTVAGTSQVYAFSTNQRTVPRSMAVLNNRLHFLVPSGSVGQPVRLWSSDGTTAGTSSYYTVSGGRIPFINSELFTTPAGYILFGGERYDALSNPQGGLLFRTDGTAAGTSTVETVGNPLDFTLASDRVYAGPYTIPFDGSTAIYNPGLAGLTYENNRELTVLGRHVIARDANTQAMKFFDADTGTTTTLAAGVSTRLAALSPTRAVFVSSGSLIAFDETTRTTTTLATSVPFGGTSVQVSGGRVVFGSDSPRIGTPLAFSDGVSVAPMKVVTYTAAGEVGGRLTPDGATVDGQPIYATTRNNALQFRTADPEVDIGSIVTAAFVDSTRDGQLQSIEIPLNGLFRIDVDNDGIFSTWTINSSNNFTAGLAGLPVGTYAVSFEHADPSQAAAYPTGGPRAAVVVAGQSTTVSFASTPPGATIWGNVYNDLNGNGTRESNEPALVPGIRDTWTVYLDVNGNALLESNEPKTTVTRPDGLWVLDPQFALGSGVVRFLEGDGRVQTQPAGLAGAYAFTISSTTDVVGPLAFGRRSFTAGAVAGSVYLDSNRNGVLDPGEPPLLPGQLVGGLVPFIDSNGDGVRSGPIEKEGVVGAAGAFSLAGVMPGAYQVKLRWTDPRFVQTSPTEGAAATVNVTDGATATAPPILLADISGGGTLGGGTAPATPPLPVPGPGLAAAGPAVQVAAQPTTPLAPDLRQTIVARPDGTFVAIYSTVEFSGTTTRKLVAQPLSAALAPIGSPAVIVYPGTTAAASARSDASGGVLVAVPSQTNLLLYYLEPGGTWRGAPVNVTPSGTANVNEAGVVYRASDDTWAVVWHLVDSGQGESNGAYLQRFTSALVPSGARRMLPPVPFSSGLSIVSLNVAPTPTTDGGVAIAWQQFADGQPQRVAVTILNASGDVTSQFGVSRVDARRPRIAVDSADGSIVVGWVGEGGGAAVQWFSPTGAPLTPANRVDLMDSAGSVELSVNAGVAAIAYEASLTNDVVRLARVVRSGATATLLTTPFQLHNSATTPRARVPALAQTGGQLVASWRGTTSNAASFEVRRFTPSATNGLQVISASFAAVPRVAPDNAPHRFVVQLDRPISIASGVAATLVHTTRGLVLSRAVSARISASDPTRAEFLVTLPDGLPDGRYRLTVPRAMLVDALGNMASGDIVIDVNFLLGDATGDGAVNFDDLLVLAANYNQSGRTTAQGDFNYDGAVNFDDLLILAARYNTSLPTAGIGGTPAPLVAPPAANADEDGPSPSGRWHDIDA
jgi:hypothetical protein